MPSVDQVSLLGVHLNHYPLITHREHTIPKPQLTSPTISAVTTYLISQKQHTSQFSVGIFHEHSRIWQNLLPSFTCKSINIETCLREKSSLERHSPENIITTLTTEPKRTPKSTSPWAKQARTTFIHTSRKQRATSPVPSGSPRLREQPRARARSTPPPCSP